VVLSLLPADHSLAFFYHEFILEGGGHVGGDEREGELPEMALGPLEF